ncbi:hypothetical protein GOP47_0001718 [Adiantum capillus-veneris]|uniref:Protein kinase domain-containing protein n=1 Tax=Adiantum capillus-veneris TaxID=13818 RepID=A0A9D4V8S9_ADICA|nr:hypothetical protein GOP47_0001718 [Adiantum capillus-veneris]
MEKKVFPTEAAAYDLLEEIGRGARAVVYRGTCKTLNETVAIKRLDLDTVNSNLVHASAEAQIMSLIDHPNVINSYCSFIVDHFLWVVMPYMDGGSCLHLMKLRYPEGLEEPLIAVILKETLKGLDYLHQQQHIHRDVKAGNILIDSSGAVKLGDFGTSACMFNGGDRQRCRRTLTGTPCWMAPEVLEEKIGYDCSADIWSFGITALELAHGHAPFSKYPPQKVLLMTMTSAAPCLDREKDKHFSKAFKDVIKLCLNKEPSRRPTTEKLLKHPFFKHTKYNPTVVQKVLTGLGPLWEREKLLRDKDAALLASRKPAFLQEEERSRNEYKRGVSCWSFDVESLKDQAAAIHDEEEISSTDKGLAVLSPCGEEARQSLTLDTHQFRRSYDREPKQFGRFGVFDGDLELESPGWHVVRPIRTSEDAQKLPTIVEDKGRNGSSERGLENLDSSNSSRLMDVLPNGKSSVRHDDDSKGKASEETGQQCKENGNSVDVCKENGNSTTVCKENGNSNGVCKENGVAGCSFPPKKGNGNPKVVYNENGVAGCSFPPMKGISNNPDASIESAEEKHKETQLLQFNVSASTFQDINLSQSIQVRHEPLPSISEVMSVPASHLGPQLKTLLLQTVKQYEVLADLLRTASPGEAINVPLSTVCNRVLAEGEFGDLDCTSNCHSDVDNKIHQLKSKVASLTKELVSVKQKNMQLERQLNAIYNRQESSLLLLLQAPRVNVIVLIQHVPSPFGRPLYLPFEHAAGYDKFLFRYDRRRWRGVIDGGPMHEKPAFGGGQHGDEVCDEVGVAPPL